MKTAFIHIMKSAGSTVNHAMTNNAFWSESYLLLHAEIYCNRDWTDYELREFLTWKTDRAYVHNHSNHWSVETIREYGRQGWLTFSFYRHPGDQWCSFYYWSRNNEEVKRRHSQEHAEPIAWKFSLDEFLQLAWTNETPNPQFSEAIHDIRRGLDLPDCWREMGYVDIWSNENFERFIAKYFDKTDMQLAPRNESANKGYEHYRREGLISDRTHEQLINSDRFRDYESLLEQPHEPSGPENYPTLHRVASVSSRFSRIPILKQLGAKSNATRYVILSEAGAASRFLIEYLDDHPDIHSFKNEFDRFEQIWSNQKKWLHNFYLRLPNKRDRSIQAIGFITGLDSISDPAKFREFLEAHQVKVIYLSMNEPLQGALSDLRDLCEPTDKAKVKNETELTSEEFCQAMERIRQHESLMEYVGTLNVPKMALDYETLLFDEALLLNKLWLFLGVGTARKSDDIRTDRPTYFQGPILNLKKLRCEFPEFQEYL